MLKCPNCGSTAQFRIAYEGETANQLYRKWKCGCGATAEEIFKKLKWFFGHLLEPSCKVRSNSHFIFRRAAHDPAGALFPLYHSPANLSIGNLHKNSSKYFPKIVLDK